MDPVTIAQSGIDPVTGSPLSAEVRKALFKRTITPSSVFGRGGALVKRTDDSSSLVVAQTQQISTLQEQINSLRSEVIFLNTGLVNIGNLIQQDSVLEQQRLKGEQENERKLAERQVRIGKESELERKITAALAAPIIALERKVSGVFGNIGNALTTLFLGWLTNQGIETLKAAEQGNKEKLQQIKDNVLKNIAYAIGAIAAINVGFGLVVRSVLGIAGRISGIAIRLALAPFRFAGSQLAKAPLVGRLFGAGARKPPTTPKPRVPVTGGNWTNKLGNFFRGIGSSTRGATGAASAGKGLGAFGRFVPGLNVALGGAATAYDISQKDYAAASLSATSMIPGPIGWIGAGLRLGYGYLKGEGGETQVQAQVKTEPKAAPPATVEASPQSTMMPNASELSLTPPQESASQSKGEVRNSITNANVSSSQASSTPSLISSTQLQGLPTPSPNVGALPEPEPNVIMMPSGGNNPQQSLISSASSGTDVPLISSSNPDNFYVLYSQLNYNVVM
jgi:hypothetical protein